MLGYLKDDIKTSETVIDGWIGTGDKGYVDKLGEASYGVNFNAINKALDSAQARANTEINEIGKLPV